MPVQVKEQWDHQLTDADRAIMDNKCLELMQAGKFNGVVEFDTTADGAPTRVFADQASADEYVAAVNTITPPPRSVVTAVVDSMPPVPPVAPVGPV